MFVKKLKTLITLGIENLHVVLKDLDMTWENSIENKTDKELLVRVMLGQFHLIWPQRIFPKGPWREKI